GQSQFHVFGTSPSPTLVVVPMPTNSALIAEFRKSTYMAATANGQLYQFNLDATSQLLPALSECVSQNKAGVTAHIKVQKTKPQAPAVASAKTEQPAATTAPSADLQIEAIELATNFILKTQLHNPKVLSRAQTPVDLASFGAAWISDEATGTVTILLPRGNTKGIDIAAAVAGSDARQCRGKFASGRVSELVDSDVVFRGFSTCEDSAGSRVAQYFIVPRGRGGFVIFSLVSNMNTEASRKVTRDESLGDFRKAALTVVTP
ncbi:MAG TPA: hypothetical protein VEK73_10705, partial [Xanthobacteraceae bacterium]|nr:hypothetical protein [Xanthobacteraceae bacterium]